MNYRDRFDELLTLQEYIEKHGDTAMWEGVTISPQFQLPVIKDIIKDWFWFRRVTDNDRFARYFNRKMRLISRQYSQLFRGETVEVDPLVANYLERQNNFTRTLSVLRKLDGSNSSTTNNEATSTRTPNLTSTNKDTGTVRSDDTGTVKTDGKSNSSSNHSNTESSKTGVVDNTHGKSLNGKLPMSDGYGKGFPTELNWVNASEQNENDTSSRSTNDTKTDGRGDSSTTINSNNTQTLNTQNLSTRDLTNTTTTSGNDKTVNYGSGSVTGTNKQSETNSHNDTTSTKEVYTGRTGILPSQALESYRDYIYSTNSTEWLISELEVCFMPEFY